VIFRNGDETGISDYIQQNFHPRRHERTSLRKRIPQAVIRSAGLADSSPSPNRAHEKPRRNPKTSDGVFHAFTSRKVAALEKRTPDLRLRSAVSRFFCPWFRRRFPASAGRALQLSQSASVISPGQCKEVQMKRALAILAVVATVGATTITAPAQARGIGPGLAFGLAAGAIAAGVAGAYGPYYYGPGYGYYGPRYYGPTYYGPGPYAYYGGPYYRHHYYYRHW
jgi:hypothetical protein